MPIDINDLEVVLNRETDLKQFETARVLLMVQERVKKDWENASYVVYSALVDSGISKPNIEGVMNAMFDEDEWNPEEHHE